MFSIVIPAYIINKDIVKMTNECVRVVRENTKPKHEIVLVYSDKSNRMTYAQSVNSGVERSSGKYIVVLNNDVNVCTNWIESMMECFALPECGIATLLGNEHAHSTSDSIIEDFYGPCWMINRSFYDELGKLDEQFVNSFEDADYWVRCYLAGKKIYRNLNAMVEHKERATGRLIKTDKQDYIDNGKKFINKYGELDLPIYRKLRP